MYLSFPIFMSARADYSDICGYDKKLITMYSIDVKDNNKLVRSDTNNYQVVAAGCQVLIFSPCHLPVPVQWCEPLNTPKL